MKIGHFSIFTTALILACAPAFAEHDMSSAAKVSSTRKGSGGGGSSEALTTEVHEAETLSTTHHSVYVNSKELHYTATAGRICVGDSADQGVAVMFFTAYTVEPAPEARRRPLTFAFNGGPGASSMWLHLAVAGPRRALFGDAGTTLPVVDTLVDNEYTWLPFTDLVFVDPVGTGYSRAAPQTSADKFFTVDGDIKIAAQFVRAYLSKYKRWTSPKFIAGESYGTVRAVGLTGYLQDAMSMVVDGTILISSALDFGLISFRMGNDLPYALALPSYAATAWYHGKLAPAKMKTDVAALTASAEQWARTRYLLALTRGATLSASGRNEIIDSLAAYSGLPQTFIRDHDMRIDRFAFLRHLLWDQDSIVGILDGRTSSLNASRGQPNTYSDPSMFVIAGPLTALINDYIRRDLAYSTQLEYVYLSDEVNRKWQWSSPSSQGYLSMTTALRDAMSANARLRVFAAMGYYDLTTPFSSQSYVFEHLRADSTLLHRIACKCYPAGHQIYTDPKSLKQLTADVEAFMGNR